MKDVQGIAQRVATNAEGFCELDLRRELGAGFQLAVYDQRANALADLPGLPLFKGRPGEQTEVRSGT
jgi:hypothetical protein